MLLSDRSFWLRRFQSLISSTTARRGKTPQQQIEVLEQRCLLSATAPGSPTRTHLFDLTQFLSTPSSAPSQEIATGFLETHATALGLQPSDVANPLVTDNYRDEGSGTTHIYLQQELNGLGIEGAFLNINITGLGEVINVGSSFVTGLDTLAADPAYAVAPGLTAVQALSDVTDDLGLSTGAIISVVAVQNDLPQSSVLQSGKLSSDPITAALNFVSTATGVRLAWHLNLQTLDHQHWYDLEVDAQTGALLSLSDWVDDLETYDALHLPVTQSPEDGGRTILVNPANPTASPFGWHDTNGVAGAEFTDTRGNNVFAQEDVDANDFGGTRPDGGSGLLFDSPLDLTQGPDTYRPAAITNLFYVNNILHDIHQHYGFTEAAGNFQFTNYSGQGSANDAVQADAQDGSGTDNANFATPPDGTNPRMQQYVFDLTTPYRDSDLENGIITHEYGHGVSNRLTGGPANSNALNALQSGGMGEGWSDWWALMLTQRPTDTANQGRPLGPYVFGNPPNGVGVRTYPYSLDMTIDPHTWADYNNVTQEVHYAGEIWCSALWDMNWLLIGKYGFDPDLYSGYSAGAAGNKLALQLVMDGLKLQPVNPSFIDARDAILLADRNLTGGDNQREIWAAFARRGLGNGASTTSANSTRVTVSTTLPPQMNNPGITDHSPNSVIATPANSIVFNFSEAMNTTSFSVAADVVSFTGPGGMNLVNQITGFTWVTPQSLRVNFNTQTAQGLYSIVLGPQILAADNGSALDQDTDGTAGEPTDDRYSASFRYDSVSLQVTSTSPANGALITLPFNTLRVNFNEPIDFTTVAPSDLEVSQGTVTAVTQIDADTVEFTLGAGLTEGPLHVNFKPGSIRDPFGFPIEFFTATYNLDVNTVPFPVPLTPAAPLGSLVYEGQVSGVINVPTDTDNFTIDLEPGMRATVVVTPTASLRPSVKLLNSTNQTVGTNTAATPGVDAALTGLLISQPGTYTIRVGESGGTAGNYTVKLYLNAALESELPGATSNNTPGSAQSLNSAFQSIGIGSVASVLGVLDGDIGTLASEIEPNNSTSSPNSAVGNFVPHTGNLYQMGIDASIQPTNDVDAFRIGQLQAGDVLTVSMIGTWGDRGTLFDSFLELFRDNNGNGVLVTSDDDSGGAADSLIYRFTITTTDTYYLKATSFGGFYNGTYSLGLLLQNSGAAPNTGVMATSETEPNGTQATANDFSSAWRRVDYQSSTVASTGDYQDFFEYQFEAGDLVTINAIGTGSLDSWVRLFSIPSAFNPIRTVYLNNPGPDDAVYGFVVPTTGKYQVEVNALFGSIGPYQLDVYLSSPTAPPVPSSVYDTYSFTLQAGQHLTLAAEGLSAGNLGLQLVNAGGTVLSAGTNTATNVDQTIVDFVAPTTGTYFAQVHGDRNVRYNLSVLRGATFDLEDNNTIGTAQPLTLPTTVLGDVSGNDDWYSVSLNAGETIMLSTHTPGDQAGEFINVLDPRLEIYDPTDTLVLSDDNSRTDGRNIAVSFTAATAGMYRVRVLGTGGGEYALTVAHPPNVTLSLQGNPFAEAGGTATVRATLSAVSDLDVVVNLAYTGGAVVGQDFQGATSLTILAGQLSASLTLTGIDDPRDENNESVVVDIDSVVFGAEATPQQVTATILDDDPPPTLTLTVDQTVIAENVGTATLTVTSSAISELDVTVNLAFAGSAIFGTDYTVAGVSLVIPAGQTLATLLLTAVSDSAPENHETVDVSIDTVTNGLVATPQIVGLIIADDDHDPIAVADAIALAEGATATVLIGGSNSLLTNDSDGDLPYDTLTVDTTPVLAPAHGSLVLQANGKFTYIHDGTENFTDQFTYRVHDANGGPTSTAVVSITITPVNDNTPVGVTDQLKLKEGDSANALVGGAVSLLFNDTDVDLPNDQLTMQTTPVIGPQFGTLTLFADGRFYYTHDGSETISDSFQYRVIDAVGHASIGTVSITIDPVNDNPISRPDVLEVLEGGTAGVLLNGKDSVLDNDSDAESPNSALRLEIVTPPSNGLLNLNLTTGKFSYVHNGSETQSDSFVYRLIDPQNGSSEATVSIRIIPVNNNYPVAVGDSVAVQQGGTIRSLIGGEVSVTKNDTDLDLPFDTLTVTQMSGPSNGTLSLAADGSFVYTHNGTQTSSDSFTYKLTDKASRSSNTATVNIAIKLINQKPIVNAGGPYLLNPGTDLILNGTGSNDPDHDSLTYRWDIKGDGTIDATTVSPTISWSTLAAMGLVSGVTTVKLEVRDPSGLSSVSSTTLQIGSTYQFVAPASGTAEYIISTINGGLDIRKVGTTTNLAPIGLTAITGVNIVGSPDNETFLVQSPSRTLSFTIDGNNGTDIVKVQGTALADTMNVASSSGRILVSKTTGVPFYVSATSDYIVVLGSDGNDTLDARQVTAALLTGLQLSGENGNDTLTGGLGNDAFVGGDGTDLLSEVGPGNVVLTDTSMTGHGTDTVGTDIEAIKLTGDVGNNLLDASLFTRFGVFLDGAAGNDTLLGSSQPDSLIGGDGIDEVRHLVSGNATLSNTLLVLGTAPSTVSDGLVSIEKVRLTGNASPNKMDASSFSVLNGSVTLDGSLGNDTLLGGSTSDLIIGGPDTIPSTLPGATDNDSLLGNGGDDTIKGGAGNDLIDGGDGNDGLAGGNDNDTIRGGNGNDTILGGAGNDSLRGGAGRDLIQGGQGKDNIDGEGDVDTVMGGSGGGSDSGDKIFDRIEEVNENFRFTVNWLNLI